MKSVFFMQICKKQYVHFLQKTANSAAHLRPGRDTQPNNEVHLASVLHYFRYRSPAKQHRAFGVPLTPLPSLAPQPNSIAHLASVPQHFRHRSPAKQHRAFGVRPTLLLASVPPHHFRESYTAGGCPPRGPRRGNVNRGMKSLNRYAPLGPIYKRIGGRGRGPEENH